MESLFRELLQNIYEIPMVSRIETANTRKGNLAILSLLSNFCKGLHTINNFLHRKSSFSDPNSKTLCPSRVQDLCRLKVFYETINQNVFRLLCSLSRNLCSFNNLYGLFTEFAPQRLNLLQSFVWQIRIYRRIPWSIR